MTIEKWVKEEKMRLGRFELYCVNAQKEEAKSFPLRMPRAVGVDSIAPGMIH
jgi:hypothetical protein